MKKLLLTLALLLMISLTSGAQNAKRPNPRYRHHTEYSQSGSRHHARHIPDYVGDVRFHVMGSIGQGGIIDLFRHRNPRMFTVGGMLEYQAGRAVSIGLGGEFYGSYCSWSRPYPDLDFYTYSLPVYGNLRLMIPTGKVRPFIEGRIGYAIPLRSAYSYRYQTDFQAEGLFTGFGFGLVVGHSNFSIGMNFTDLYDVYERHGRVPWNGFDDFYFRYSFAFGL